MSTLSTIITPGNVLTATNTQTVTNKDLSSGTNTFPAFGDVDGPASSTDNAIARFDGTTGKLIQNSAVTIADTTGNIAFNGSGSVGITNDNGAINLFTEGSQRAAFTQSGIGFYAAPVSIGTAGSKQNLILNGAIDETVYAVSGTTPALSPSNGTIQTWTLSASSTPTAGTWNEGESMTLMVNDTVSTYTVTWTSVPVTWVGGSAPTLVPGGGYTVIELWKVSTTIYGALVGQVA